MPRKKMKGGNLNADKIEEIKSESSYAKYDDNLFIRLILSIALVGIVWFLLSRSLVRHRYSEAMSYSLIAVSVLISLLLVLIAGLRIIKGGSGFIGALKKILSLATFVLSKGLPGILILVQLAVLIFLMSKHGDYLFKAKNYPPMFTEFNIMALLMIAGQLYVWKNLLAKIVLQIGKPNNPMTVPGFILAAILSGVAISQLFIILEFLKTDC